MKTARYHTFALALLCAAALPACDIPNPTENVDVRLNIVDARVELTGLGAVPLVAGQATERTTVVSPGSAIKSLDAVQSIRLDPSHLTYTPAAGDANAGGANSAAAAAAANGTVLVALRAGNRPLLAAVVTVTNGTVSAIDPSVATLAVAVDRIRAHAATAAQHTPGADALLGDWNTLTVASLFATLESIMAGAQTGLTLAVLPLTGNLSGSLGVAEFSIDATVTTQR